MPSAHTSDASLHTPRRARVQLPQAVSALDYAIPANMTLQIGQLVLVELRKKTLVGVIIALSDDPDQPILDAAVPNITYKPLIDTFPHIPALHPDHLRYLNWLADYYLVSRGIAYRLAFNSNADFYTTATTETSYRITKADIPKLGGKQQALFEAIKANQAQLPKRALLKQSQSTAAQCNSLLKKNLIEEVPLQQAQPIQKLATLSTEQHDALMLMCNDLEQHTPQVSLLDGTTGSGKTEVYFHLMAAAFTLGKQVIVLLPEVSLLIDWQHRFHARFGFTPPAWHNGISPKTRRTLWQQAANGNAKIIVGARSALHLPMQNLGLIIVDEEHDFSYKQEDNVPYHARDMAVLRAQILKIPLLLASATPSFESLENARRNKYRYVALPARYKTATLPEIHLIDTKQHRPKPKEWLSPPLIKALHETLDQQQQALLFLNRRGYAPLLLCRYCNHRFDCPNCDVYLSEHKYPKPHLNCHHCGYQTPRPSVCPKCNQDSHLSSSGPGVERIIADLEHDFPNARTFAATAESLNSPENIAGFLSAMNNREIDIVVGTQIIAKGLDFPYLTLAGVIDADQALFGSNPRAGEQTWQLLHQIAGRTGRHHLAGRAFLQTQKPEDILFQSLKAMNRDTFMQQQVKVRQAAMIPPFGRMVAIIVQSRDAKTAETTAKAIAKQCPTSNTEHPHRILGPMPAPIARLRGWYRQRLLLLAARQISLQPIAYKMLTATKIPATVRIKVDVDPYNFV